MYYIGIDLGGTNIKVAAVDENYRILAEADRPTNAPRAPEAICDDILLTLAEVMEKAQLSVSDVGGIGIGCPGSVDTERGVVTYSNNLDWHDFGIAGYIQKHTGLATALANDANVAALGEVAAGIAKGTSSAVIITLGTGVGSGVVLDGKILMGFGGGASEIGHVVIEEDGWPCTCGRKGCFESYSSATGLIRMTKEAIAAHPESGLARIAKERGRVDGRTSFDGMREGDAVATGVVQKYLKYLACGTTNVVNIFQPEVIAFSGGISKEGETLLGPLRSMVEKQMFGGPSLKMTRFEICTLGHRAGIIGAAELAKQRAEAAG